MAAKLWHARLNDARLSHADFTDAQIWDADFRNANLEGALLRTEHVNSNTLFHGASLKGATLSHAVLALGQGVDATDATVVDWNARPGSGAPDA